MNIVRALAADLSVTVATRPDYDWRTAPATWGIFTLVGAIVLILRMPRTLEERKKTFKKIDDKPSQSLWHSKLAWAVTFYMGLQSLIPYTLFAWLPAMLIEKGFTQTTAGWLM